MPLTFAEAYAKVCPAGDPVAPNSKEYADIMELMRQSGYVPLHDRLVKDMVPKVVTSIDQIRPYTQRGEATLPTGKVSKRQWLSVDANKQDFLKHLSKNIK